MRKVTTIVIHAAIWIALFVIPFHITGKGVSLIEMFGTPGGVSYPLSFALMAAYAYANYFMLVPRFYLRRRYVVYALLVVGSLLFIMRFPHLFFGFGIKHDEPPGGEPHDGSGMISLGAYNVIYFIICTFGGMSIRQQRRLLEVQKEKLDAELSFLKAQINPHFLFNTLNSIYSLAIQKSDDTPRALIQLSELMRYILQDSDENTVPLDVELKYISNYVELQRRRLRKTVRIAYAAPEEITRLQIVPLILTSFVENAFKHGVNPNQDSNISITIALEGRLLKMRVINNKVSTNNKEETMGIGLKNATSRLEHLYPGKHKLRVDDAETTFSVDLEVDLND